MKFSKTTFLGFVATAALSANTLFGATAVVSTAGFVNSSLAANDDGSTGLVGFGFAGALNFYGSPISGAFLNNNGNMTFGGPLGTFTPSAITAGSLPMIAPFFADVDTRGAGSALMTYGTGGTFDGHAAFHQTWGGVGVGYFGAHVDKLNIFQTLLVDRSDIAAGDFDIYFNYNQIQWETGDASGGVGGLGGVSAHAGYTDGAGHFFELAGSGVNGALIDGGPNALTADSLNSAVVGRYLFEVRGGVVVGRAPDGGSTMALLGLALVALAAVRRKLS